MKIIKVTNQSEWNSLPKSFNEFTEIRIYGNIEIFSNPKNSQATLWENSQATLRENSQATLWGNSQATLRDNSQATLWGNSQATLWGNSQATGYGNAAIHNYTLNPVLLYGFSVCWLLTKTAKATKKSVNSTIINFQFNSVKNWIENDGVETDKNNNVIIFKRVSKDFKTQEGSKNETLWRIEKEIEIENWDPKNECGEGKFHGCSHAFFCDDFRDKEEDRHIAVKVAIKDLVAFPEPKYPNKISFRKGFVLWECDRNGKKI